MHWGKLYMGNLLIMNIFTNILDIYILYYFLRKILGKSFKSFLNISVSLVIAILCNTLINTTLGLVNITGLIIMLISSTLIFKFIFNKNNLLKIFILVATGLTLMFIMELIVINGISILFRISPNLLLQLNYFRLIGILLSKTLFLAITYLAIGFLKENYNWIKQLSFYPISILVIINLLIVFMAFVFYSHVYVNTRSEMIYIMGMGVAAIVVSSVIAWIIKKMIDQQKKEFVLQIKEKEYENQQIYLEHIQEVIQTLRAQRHDFNNYVSTIYGLIHLEKIEEAKKYILNLSKDEVDLNEVVNVYHPVVGAVLNMKKEKAARNKIDFIVDVDLPSKLPFDFVDLSTILGNLLDNAIEACEKVSDIHTKIDIKMYIKNMHMIIKIENSKSDKIYLRNNEEVGYVTTKSDKENHGIGLKNVSKAVNKYKGFINIQDKGKEFLVDIALPIKESATV